jgi:hypothetical protein
LFQLFALDDSDSTQREELGNKCLELKVDYLAAGDDNVIPDPKMKNKEPLTP